MSCLFIIAIIYFYFLSFFAGFTSTSEGEFACPERFDHEGARVRELRDQSVICANMIKYRYTLAKNRKRNSTRLIILGRTLNMTNGKTVRSCMVRRSRSPKIRLFCSLINCKADTTSVLRVQQTLGFGLELKLIPTRASEPEGHASHRASHASHPSKGNEK